MTPYLELLNRFFWFLFFLVSIFPSQVSLFDIFVVPFLKGIFLGSVLIVILRVLIIALTMLFGYLVFKHLFKYNLFGVRNIAFGKR